MHFVYHTHVHTQAQTHTCNNIFHTYMHAYTSWMLVQADPEDWSVDQVCEWLDQIGLGYYAAIFQGMYTLLRSSHCVAILLLLEHQIDGSALCSLDMQTFGR